MTISVLILPGIGNSGPQHWQTLWEAANPSFRRVYQRDWEHPICQEWVAALDAAVRQATAPPVLVAHSLACLVVMHWAAATTVPVHAALLVAIPDPSGPAFPTEAQGFVPLPLPRLAFPSIVVASSNDPYATLAFDRQCAEAMGSRLVEAGAQGHLNAASNLGDWPIGMSLLHSLF